MLAIIPSVVFFKYKEYRWSFNTTCEYEVVIALNLKTSFLNISEVIGVQSAGAAPSGVQIISHSLKFAISKLSRILSTGLV